MAKRMKTLKWVDDAEKEGEKGWRWKWRWKWRCRWRWSSGWAADGPGDIAEAVAADRARTMTRDVLGPDDVVKWKHFRRYWPFVRGIHRSPMNSPHKGHWRGALMFSLISARINGWVNNREAGDLRHIRPHYDVTIMNMWFTCSCHEQFNGPFLIDDMGIFKYKDLLARYRQYIIKIKKIPRPFYNWNSYVHKTTLELTGMCS